MPYVGWGTALLDFNNDGWVDTFVTNGHVDDNRDKLGQNVHYEEPPLLFAIRSRQETVPAGNEATSAPISIPGTSAEARRLEISTTMATIDIVVNHKDRPAALLRNDTKSPNHWVRLELQGTKSNRDAIGTRVEVEADGRTIYRQRKGGVSMMSANDPRLLIGVGAGDVIPKITLRWPSGIVSTMENVKTDQSYKVVEPAK